MFAAQNARVIILISSVSTLYVKTLIFPYSLTGSRYAGRSYPHGYSRSCYAYYPFISFDLKRMRNCDYF
jgi:hypothetical protein